MECASQAINFKANLSRDSRDRALHACRVDGHRLSGAASCATAGKVELITAISRGRLLRPAKGDGLGRATYTALPSFRAAQHPGSPPAPVRNGVRCRSVEVCYIRSGNVLTSQGRMWVGPSRRSSTDCSVEFEPNAYTQSQEGWLSESRPVPEELTHYTHLSCRLRVDKLAIRSDSRSIHPHSLTSSKLDGRSASHHFDLLGFSEVHKPGGTSLGRAIHSASYRASALQRTANDG